MTYVEMSNMVEKMDNYEKKFVLWTLLQDYSKELENGASTLNDPKTVEEFAIHRMMMDHAKTAKEMAEVISFEIF